MAVAQESKDSWTLNGRRDTLTAKALRTVAAEKRVAELEAELSAAREELAHRDNKILSLEKSLDLNADEGSRLAGQLAERSATIENAQQQLEEMRLALNAARAERHKANGKWQQEASVLSTQLEAALARAEKAEKLLADAQNDLLALSLENSAALRRISDLKSSLRERARQIEAQESKLADEIKTRDGALKRAEERIRLLAELFMQLEAKANHRGARENSEADSPLPYGQMERVARTAAANEQRNSCAVLERDLDNDAWLFGSRRSARLS
jgi:chromosome segregation ATPase